MPALRDVPKVRLQRQALAEHGDDAHEDQHAGGVGQHCAQELGVLTAHVHGSEANRERLRRDHLTGGDTQGVNATIQ